MADTFAHNIKMLRKSRGLSQKELAEALGLSQPAICGYETGAYTPQVARVLEFASYFGVPVEDLLTAKIESPVTE